VSEALSWLGVECDCSACVFLFRAVPGSFVCFYPSFGEGADEETSGGLMEVLNISTWG
jgi:hypothetical protein